VSYFLSKGRSGRQNGKGSGEKNFFHGRWDKAEYFGGLVVFWIDF
jgi:hypothetical protein